MENFCCYYCAFKTNCVNQLLQHVTILHENETLKYRELSLDEATGKFRNVTKTHQGIIPSELKHRGKTFTSSDNSKIVVKSKYVCKKLKLNTPVKVVEQTPEDDNCDSDDLAEKLKKLSVSDEISILLPKVIENLEESGHLDYYLKYNELLASGRLPFDNICYLLFLDVVEWSSTENT